MWFGILKSLLSCASWVSKYMHDRQLIDAGEYKQMAKALQEEKKRVKQAKDIRLRDNPSWRERVRNKYERHK